MTTQTAPAPKSPKDTILLTTGDDAPQAEPPEPAGDVVTAADVATTHTAIPSFGPGDLQMSRLRLAQGLTQEVQDGVARPGQYVLSGLPAMTAVVIVPLSYAKMIRRFGEVGDNKKRYVACNNHLDTAAADCPNCRTQFEEALTRPGAAITWILDEYYSYQVYLVEHKMPAMLEFARTGMAAGRLLNTLIMTRKIGQFAVSLSGMAAKNGKGSYFVPNVALAQVSDADLAAAAQFLAA